MKDIKIKLRKVNFALLTAGVIVFSTNACSNSKAQSSNTQPSNTKLECWKYTNIYSNFSMFPEKTLNNLGKAGWELVAVTVSKTNSQGVVSEYQYILKRKIQ